jgi:hypothetical protein
MIVSPAETVDTVNVSTSNFDAEQGMAGGAAITVITKSGTNKFSGSGFAFYNNEKLNAKPYFATQKSPASAHIDGATLGGPIQKNRVFFFGAWEGQYQTTPQQFFYAVPPAALRGGDFSQAFNPDGSLHIIDDPRTGNPDGTGRTPFQGNVIPPGLISSIAKKLQSPYPLPNAAGSTSGGNVGGVSGAATTPRSRCWSGTRPGGHCVTRRACTACASTISGTRSSPSWPRWAWPITCSNQSAATCRAGCWSTTRTSGSTRSGRRLMPWTPCGEAAMPQTATESRQMKQRSRRGPRRPHVTVTSQFAFAGLAAFR